MDPNIEEKFEKMGARISIGENPVPNVRRNDQLENSSVTVNVLDDKKGQIFDIKYRGKVDISIIDLQPDDRHLVMMAKLFDTNKPHQDPDKIKFLCGHDEREWFSSQLPNRSITNVKTAKLALLPGSVHRAHDKAGVKEKDRTKRKNKGSLRQGEWLFVPVEIKEPPPAMLLYKEPLMVGGNTRGGSKPHMAEIAYRTGGVQVYVPTIPFRSRNEMTEDEVGRLSAGLAEPEKKKYIKQNSDAKKWTWMPMMRNPQLYVRGNIRHQDHKTLKLRQWHRVYMNEEVRGKFNVFLD